MGGMVMKTIEEVAFDCEIAKKRERLLQNRREMLRIYRMMSDLTLHKNVAQYVYYLNNNLYFLKKKNSLTQQEGKEYLQGQLYLILMNLLQDDPYVKMYCELKKEYDRMERECREYYQTIQTPFREGLKETDLPNIFVYQGMLDSDSQLKLSRHIILGELHEVYKSTPNIVIHPVKELSSKKTFKHFYNHVSFHYLEQMSQDFCSDVKTKKLGGVIIREGEDFL